MKQFLLCTYYISWFSFCIMSWFPGHVLKKIKRDTNIGNPGKAIILDTTIKGRPVRWVVNTIYINQNKNK